MTADSSAVFLFVRKSPALLYYGHTIIIKHMSTRTIVILSNLLGIVFILIALVYWLVPAGSLPSFMPGYMAGATTIHIKHGVASFLLGIALFILAWFKGGKKSVQ